MDEFWVSVAASTVGYLIVGVLVGIGYWVGRSTR